MQLDLGSQKRKVSKQRKEKNWYIFLIIIILFTLLTLKEPTITSEVILNLHNLNSSYELENPSKIKINATISKDNKITGSVILDPNSSTNIHQENFQVIGEEYDK